MPKTSLIWEFFIIEQKKISQEKNGKTVVSIVETYKCIKCNVKVKYNGNTSNLWDHVQGHHFSDYKRLKLPANGDGSIMSAFKLHCAILAARLASINRKLITYMITNMKLLNTVFSEAFKAFCAELHPDYTPPAVDSIQDMILLLECKVRELVCQVYFI